MLNTDQKAALRVINNLLFTAAAAAPSAIFSSPIAEMKMNDLLKALLVISPLIGCGVIQTPAAHATAHHKDGGYKFMLAMRAASIVGSLGLLGLSLSKDITKTDSFDWTYAGMLASGVCIGLGNAAYQTMGDAARAIKTDRNKRIVYNFYGLTGLANELSMFISQPIRNSWGYSGLFATYLGILMLGTVPGVFLTPQKNNHDDVAQEEKAPIKNSLRTSLLDLRAHTLYLSFATGLGSYIVMHLGFTNALNAGFDIPYDKTNYIAAGASLTAALTRVLTSTFIMPALDKKIKTGEIYIFIIGALLVTLATMPILLFNLSFEALLAALFTSSIGFGLAMAPPYALASKWSNPVNKNYELYDANMMMGNMGTAATIGAIILNLTLGLLAEQLDKKGYQVYFAIPLALIVLSALMIAVTHAKVNSDKPRVFGCDFNLFKCLRNFEPENPLQITLGSPTTSL